MRPAPPRRPASSRSSRVTLVTTVVAVCVVLTFAVTRLSQNTLDAPAVLIKPQPPSKATDAAPPLLNVLDPIVATSISPVSVSHLSAMVTKASPPLSPMYDLSRIRDPILELISDASIKQIHHGIYKVTTGLLDGKPLTFAFKTECRPASKWHGQQGWSEVGVYQFTQLFFGPLWRGTLATAPPARGVLVSIPKSLAERVVHRDRCGLVMPEELSMLKRVYPHLTAGLDARSGADSEYALYSGVALTWQARHDDNALPPPSSASWFRPSATTTAAELTAQDREKVSQMSDVSLMDYLLSNEDREEKNWFYDAAGRYVMMDNGWAFAGRGYKGSVCSEERALLTCPPIMRHWAGAKCTNVVNCRFRFQTSKQLNETLHRWIKSEELLPAGVLSAKTAWLEAMAKDPLVALFLETYGSQNVRKEKSLIFNNGLARYVQGCPEQQVGEADRLVHVLDWLALGLERRMHALQTHIGQCVATYGSLYVYGNY